MSSITSPTSGAARFGRIPTATARSGLSRSELYEIAAEHHGLFRKRGAATIVDLEFLDQILSQLPAAAIGAKTAAGEGETIIQQKARPPP
jgi:hypothetical protein